MESEAPTVLTARVHWDDDRYIATIDGLDLAAEGETVGEAQDGLINLMRNWIEIQDGKSALRKPWPRPASRGWPRIPSYS